MELRFGKLKSNINVEKISNLIRLERDDLSWIGINIKGTNVVVTIQESIESPEIIDKNEICNIVATKDAIISKMVVQNGTARVQVGDEVKKGDLLVEGIMESELVDNRYVHAEADIFGKIYYKKEKKESFVQNVKIKTGNEEQKNEICINNFKINFNKGVSKFENYDTISSSKKVKLFSNFYLPIEIKHITNVEIRNEQKVYSEEELKEKIQKELENELEQEYNLSEIDEKNKKLEVTTNIEEDGITLTLIYEVQEEIGTKAN